VAQRYLNLAFGFVVKNTLYAHDVSLLFIFVLGLIVFMPWICQSVLMTLSLSFLSRYYADTIPCYKFCWLVFSFRFIQVRQEIQETK